MVSCRGREDAHRVSAPNVAFGPGSVTSSTELRPRALTFGRVGVVARAAGHRLPSLREAPATPTWLTIVSITRLLLVLGTDSFNTRLLGAASTNLDNLSRHPARALAMSAFFVTGNRYYFVFAATCLLILGPLERRIGSRRWLIGAVAGHAGTTLLVAAGLALMAPASDGAGAIDVGPSYAARFLVAVYACLLPGPARRLAATFLITLSLLQLIVGRSYTDWGHLSAVALGLTFAPLLVRPTRGTPLFVPAGNREKE